MNKVKIVRSCCTEVRDVSKPRVGFCKRCDGIVGSKRTTGNFWNREERIVGDKRIFDKLILCASKPLILESEKEA